MVAMIGPRPIFSQDMRRDDHKSEAEVDMGTARGMLCFVGVFEIHVCPMELVRHCQTGVSFFLEVLVEGSGAVAWGVTEYTGPVFLPWISTRLPRSRASHTLELQSTTAVYRDSGVRLCTDLHFQKFIVFRFRTATPCSPLGAFPVTFGFESAYTESV